MYYKDITLTGPQAAIGYEDENLPTRVIIDISDLTKYGTGTTVLEVKRPCDREAYIAEQTEVDGNNFYWYPTKGDLEVSGLSTGIGVVGVVAAAGSQTQNQHHCHQQSNDLFHDFTSKIDFYEIYISSFVFRKMTNIPPFCF